jgi:hypothetical protein
MSFLGIKGSVGLILVLSGIMSPLPAFVADIGFDARCNGADAIVRGVVVEMVPVTGPVADSRGHAGEKITDGGFTGPNAVAIVRVTDLLKGERDRIQGLIFVPCGYDFDESPAELTKSKEYFLFLRSMGYHYFHPLDAFSMHRVQGGRVSLSGFDWDEDFKVGADEAKSTPVEGFVEKIRKSVVEARKVDENPFLEPVGNLVRKSYKVPEGYMYLLAEKAFEKTKDAKFEKPGKESEGTVIWEPWPSGSLKALGLEMRKGYSMALVPDNELIYAADEPGHEAFVKLNETLGIEVHEIKDEAGR